MTCKTRRARLRRSVQAIADWCRGHRHLPVKVQHAALTRRILQKIVATGARRLQSQQREAWRAPHRKWDLGESLVSLGIEWRMLVGASECEPSGLRFGLRGACPKNVIQKHESIALGLDGLPHSFVQGLAHQKIVALPAHGEAAAGSPRACAGTRARACSAGCSWRSEASDPPDAPALLF